MLQEQKILAGTVCRQGAKLKSEERLERYKQASEFSIFSGDALHLFFGEKVSWAACGGGMNERKLYSPGRCSPKGGVARPCGIPMLWRAACRPTESLPAAGILLASGRRERE